MNTHNAPTEHTTRFVARAFKWEHNQEISNTINAARVEITRDDGTVIDGVGIFSLGKPRQMLTTEAARRVAGQIIDALETIQINPGRDALARFRKDTP